MEFVNNTGTNAAILILAPILRGCYVSSRFWLGIHPVSEVYWTIFRTALFSRFKGISKVYPAPIRAVCSAVFDVWIVVVVNGLYFFWWEAVF